MVGRLLAVGMMLGMWGDSMADVSRQARIQPYAHNPYYWQYQGTPVLLLGGSVEDNLFQIPNLGEELDTLAAAGGNYVRCTMSSRDKGNVWPFAKGKDGRHDLDRWNPEYWRRFEAFLRETRRHRIIVQIEVWATFDYYRDNWGKKNPFNPKNNVNYMANESGLPVRVESHPTRAENDFFRSVPEAKHLKKVLHYQQRFVEKILSYSLAHDHVLYCMDNETSGAPEWGAYWAAFIEKSALRAGHEVEVTEMWDPWDLKHQMHSATIDHPETYSFIEISQNNHQKGQQHYDHALAHRQRAGTHPRPLTNVKIYGADGGRFGTTQDGVQRFWRNIFSGCASARFHRPGSGLGLSELAQKMIKGARQVTDAFDIFSCEPHNDLLNQCDPNEAFCLASPGKAYAVYFPDGGEVTLNASGEEAPRSIRWYDIEHGVWLQPQEVEDAGPLILSTPHHGPWAAIIKRRS